jgi:hypothetical protein
MRKTLTINLVNKIKDICHNSNTIGLIFKRNQKQIGYTTRKKASLLFLDTDESKAKASYLDKV